MYEFSDSSKKNLEGIKPALKLLFERVISHSSHDFGIPEHGGKRTAEEQNELYQIGRTKELDRKPITNLDGYKNKSYHQTGMAVDIYIYDEHGACWDCIEKYKEVADLILKTFKKMQYEGHFCKCEKLRWGGDWTSFKDYPHFEVKN